MNIVADESVDAEVVQGSRQDGHCVTYIAEVSPTATDDAVLAEATRQKAILVTADKDFGDQIYRQRKPHAGVVLLRLAGLANARKSTLARVVFRDHADKLPDAFCVVTPGNLRVRSGNPTQAPPAVPPGP